MATKLKSIKIKRISAFILSVILFSTSALSAGYWLRGTFYYNECSETGDIPDYESSSVFRKNLNRIEEVLTLKGKYGAFDSVNDYYKTDAGKKELKAIDEHCKKLQDYCDYLDNLVGFSTYMWEGGDGGLFCYSYKNGTYCWNAYGEFLGSEYLENYRNDCVAIDSGKDTENAISPEDDKTTINKIADYISFINNGTVLYYGTSSTEDIISSYKEDAADIVWGTINTKFTNYDVADLKSVKFAIFYKDIDFVYTNCEGIDYKDSRDVILEKLGGDFAEYVENSNYYSNINESESNAYNELNKLFTGGNNFNTLKDSYTTNTSIEKAYFSYDSTLASDYMSIGETTYKSFITHAAKIATDKTWLILSVIMFILSATFAIYGFSKAGKSEDGEIKLRFIDKIPFGINLAFTLLLMFACGGLFFGICYFEFCFLDLFLYNSFPFTLAEFIAKYTSEICAISAGIGFLALITLISSVIRNIRNKSFTKHTLCHGIKYIIVKFFGFIFKAIKKFTTSIKRYFISERVYGNKKKFYIISAVIIFAFILTEIIFNFSVFGIIISLLMGAILFLMLVGYCRIATGINKIKSGETNTKIDKKFMPLFMSSTADDVENIGDGLQKAIDKAVRDQATKTELITNVTHDLKTPLTSIITYIDLIKRSKSEEEKEEYIHILDEKSQKLKKLIDDLVQASKAASGNIEIRPISIDLCEFADQIMGEFSDELKNNGIELILRKPEDSVNIYADAGVTERIFENLMTNIKKYTLAGTRAYIEVSKNDKFGIISFKNISDSPIDADESQLKERFFRCDNSRTGEGSGLGLSITDNLCNIQGGNLTLETDADLFKATVYLPLK